MAAVSPNPFDAIEILRPYNRWWKGYANAFGDVPSFRRDVFDELYGDVAGLPQMVSVTGPRRVGKSTLLLQCIHQLITDSGNAQAQANRIVYFSMQDPGLEIPGFNQDRFFNELVAAAVETSKQGPTYLFLDEIQRFPRWELYLKKFYDLKSPVRFVVSGSASTPIFRKSRESLLGRIKDFHVLPFSFREWLYLTVIAKRPGVGPAIASGNSRHRYQTGRGLRTSGLDPTSFLKWIGADWFGGTTHYEQLETFLFEGGFPEVWGLPSLLAKQEYLYQNQVERVIFEDLLIAAEFRKPEMLRRFYLGLLKDPGRETNLSQLSAEIELARSTIESYFPLLEATDLVWRLHKHTSTKATPKAGNFKTYLIDLAVRNAVLKLDQERMVADTTLMGAYAENVVANHLLRWPGLVELGYWRRNNDELDFIVDLGSAMIGVEVKYRNQLQEKDVLKASRLSEQVGCETCIIVSKKAYEPEEISALTKATPIPTTVIALADFLMHF